MNQPQYISPLNTKNYVKKALLLRLFVTACAALSFTSPPETLVGRWQQKSPDGTTVVGIFRADGTNGFFINGKAFVSGKHCVRQDALGYAGAICDSNYDGTYKLHFFAQDSVRWTVIEGTCRARRESFVRVSTMGRAKSAKQ
ncbi:MAG: hypothetical protein H7Z75_19090 [Ferruginibacter sp.]|nr:hypothetical protein [Cytophagales bacterium]